MEVDPPYLDVGSSSRLALEETFILLRDKQIKLQDDREKKIYRELKGQEFTHTPTFNLALFQTIEERRGAMLECLYQMHTQPEPEVSW
jgi:hypothetical protein